MPNAGTGHSMITPELHLSTELVFGLVPPMRGNGKSLRRTHQRQSLLYRRDETARIVHRRKLGSHTPYGFYEKFQRVESDKIVVTFQYFVCS